MPAFKVVYLQFEICFSRALAACFSSANCESRSAGKSAEGAALQKNHKKIFHKPLDKRWERCIIKSKVRQGQTYERARIISTGKPNEDEGLGNKRKKRGYCIEGATEDEKTGCPQKWTRQKQASTKATRAKAGCPQRWTSNKKSVSTKADRAKASVSTKADRQQKQGVHKSGQSKNRVSTKADR